MVDEIRTSSSTSNGAWADIKEQARKASRDFD